MRIALIGPQEAKYALRPIGNTTNECEQKDGRTDEAAPAGLPPNSVQHAVITCGTSAPVKAVTENGVVHVTIQLGDFSYAFDVPARP